MVTVSHARRGNVLLRAEQIINGERQEQYGSPEDNFKVTAELWSAYLGLEGANALTIHDVAMLMALMKVGRIKSGCGTVDSYVDCAGYIGLASDINNNNPAHNVGSERVNDDDM